MLRFEAEQKSSSQYADLTSLSTTSPVRIWQQTGLDSQASKEATVVSWLYCGSYFTIELLFKMKKIKSSICACNKEISENLNHFREVFHKKKNESMSFVHTFSDPPPTPLKFRPKNNRFGLVGWLDHTGIGCNGKKTNKQRVSVRGKLSSVHLC